MTAAADSPTDTAGRALQVLADRLSAEGSVVSPEVIDPPEGTGAATLGQIVASGERASTDAAQYALVVETVLEGYLLHYGRPRILRDSIDPDLALLAGDYLYAQALELLAGLGDMEAVAELSDLISLSAQLHTETQESADGGVSLAGRLWVSSALAIGFGANPAHDAAKAALREGDPGAGDLLAEAIGSHSAAASLGGALGEAEKTVGFRSSNRG